jgi:pyruvate/2-oxoglutarate dehydrogenase complex dihydrolipoamide dehydrogenase (E3) component
MYDLVVIGAGSGGLSVAAAAAKVGARVALIEKNRPGGEGSAGVSLPGKGLVQAAKLAHRLRKAERLGLRTGPLQVDFAAVMSQLREAAAGFARGESAEALRAQGIDVYQGTASFSAYDTVQVDGATLIPSHRFVIATGSRPAIPEIPGLADAECLHCQSFWTIKTLPESLIVIGSEPAGLEIAQCFARLGSRVTVLTDSPRILPQDDPEASDLVTRLLREEGLTVKTGVEITKVEVGGGQKACKFRDAITGAMGEAAAKAVLVATGRFANIEELNLEAVGIDGDPRHGIEVDDYLQTHSTRVYAIGDVLLRHSYVQFAEQEAAVVFQNAVLRIKKKIDYSAIPRATFTDPEVAAVGTSEAQARAEQRPCLVYRVAFSEIDRARIDGRTEGFAKVVATPSGKILGATVVGEDASMIVHPFVLAMAKNLGLRDVAEAVPVYPTYAEVVHHLAAQHRARRLENSYVQTALKLFYGFIPRVAAGNGAPAPATDPEPPGAENAPVPSHGHGH